MNADIHSQRILILDFGSQYTQLIARRVREIGVYCEIYPWDCPEEEITAFNAKGFILAGGPESVTEGESPRAAQVVFDANVPILGICYGMQTMATQLGGAVETSSEREFGYAKVRLSDSCSRLFEGLQDQLANNGASLLDVWMSHGDKVVALPEGFSVIASTDSAPIAAMCDPAKNYYGVQFHPEVTHTKQGGAILERFVLDICGAKALWNLSLIHI